MSLDLQRPRLMKGDKVGVVSRDLEFLIIEKIGVGRCAFVYHARNEKSKENVALKVYNAGKRYEGALQRELSVLETLQATGDQNSLHYFGHFEALGHHCIIMELLDSSIRHIVYKNNKRGLKLWAVQKFTKDIFGGLALLHSEKLVHADIKPSNVHWCAQQGCFKLIDFGLSFHLSEKAIHQVQSEGYQAPEVQLWNRQKESQTQEYPATDTILSRGVCQNIINHERNTVNCNAVTGLYEHSNRAEKTEHKIQLLPKINVGPKKNDRNSRTIDMCSACVRPGKPIDIWSVGCLVIEVAIGRKFMKDTNLLCRSKCLQKGCPTRNLIDSCFEDIICQQTNDLNTSAGYEVLRDFVYRCCNCDPNTRLTSEDALNHPFFQLNLEPTQADCLLFSTPVLLLSNLEEQSEINGLNLPSDIAHKLFSKCQQCGPILSSSVILKTTMKGSLAVMYEAAQDCKKAQQLLSGKTFNNRTVVASFCPIEIYKSLCMGNKK